MKHKYVRIGITLEIHVRENFESWFDQYPEFARKTVQEALVKAELLHPDEKVVTIATRQM